MSVWFTQHISAIGNKKDLTKVINVNVEDERALWSLNRIHLMAGAKNTPPFPLIKISKKHPNIIFAITTLVGNKYLYRFCMLNGQYLEFENRSLVYNKFVNNHIDWANKLNYRETFKKFKNKLKIPTSIVPINKNIEICFIEEKIK